MIEPPTMRPGGSGTSRMIDSAVTLLPQPDSPTIASVSPRRTWNETSSTALNSPELVKKTVCRFFTSRTLASARRFAHQPRCLGSRMSRKASPNRLVPNTARLMAMPGKITSHGAVRTYSAADSDSIRPQDG